jgi:hypothetical protein
MRARRAGARAALVFVTAAALMLAAGTLVPAGCSDTSSHRPPVEVSSGDKLAPDTAYSVDLDADGSPEQVIVDGASATLTIRDGDVVYHSRDKWQVVEAHVGDTDHDGLLEVVTLVDGDDGRHIGLFAYFGGEYRERLVTQELSPRPLSLQVVTAGRPTEDEVIAAALAAGDLIVVTEEPTPDATGAQTTIYRWNGFGFTAL